MAAAREEGLETQRADPRAGLFVELAERHLEAGYRLAYAILGDSAEAEDATHDAFVTAWRKWHSLRDPAAAERWFDRILVNTCRNRLRTRHRSRPLDLSDELRAVPIDAFHLSDDRAEMGTAIAGLSPDHRVVVALRFYRDLTVDEIARWLQIPSGTVKSRLHHALAHLERELDRTLAEVNS